MSPITAKRSVYTFILLFLGILYLSSDAHSQPEATLLDDDFSGLPTGHLFSVVGAHLEYHYLPEAGPKGNWYVSTFTSDTESQRAWRVIRKDGESSLFQAIQNRRSHTHPMVVTGDPLWGDYNVEVEMTPQSGQGQAGVVFRSRNDRCYYFFGVEGNRAILKKVQDATAYRVPKETLLAEREIEGEPGERLSLRIECKGSHLKGSINGGPPLEAEDDTYPLGRVLLTSDLPTEFHHVRVTTTPEEKERIETATREREAEQKNLQGQNPKMVLWKKFKTEGLINKVQKVRDFGVGRNLRFGDLNGDGDLDVLIAQVNNHGPKDRNSEIGCMTAMTFDGDILWQSGMPDPWKDNQTSDVGVQIHDLDNDGDNEVIYCRDFELVVAEGATGNTLKKIPMPDTPANTRKPYDRFPKILGDSLYFLDVEGKGYPSNILVKNRYAHFWVYNSDLELLWTGECNTGHYPYAADVDGDGKDELAIGYSLYDDDGTRLWTVEDRVKDHADGVALVNFNPEKGDEIRLLCAASDEGMFFADMDGNILKHHHIGHGQNPAVLNLRDDLPGVESLSINFWGNQGIIHLYDSEGDIYHDFEPVQHGSMCLPINWTGGSEEFFVLSPNVEEGGLFDGWGRKAVAFPADGHPELCNAVMDITGDCRDEIVVWDPYEIWVYTQDDNPKEGKLYSPKRNSLSNYSNYQTTVSLPIPNAQNRE